MKVKNDTPSLDTADLEILKDLQEDSRQTYLAIGKRLGIAHSTVYERIKKMEQHGIIRKYTVLIDIEKPDARNITAIMSVYTDPKETETVARKLAESTEVIELYTCISEELLVLAKVVAATQEDLHAFIANSIAPLPGVLRIRTSIITKKFKEAELSITDCSKGAHL
jgi:DNA-binding Lrp family transcriptional regulator